MLCVREVADESERKLFTALSPAVSTASWRVLYSLIVGAAWCVAPHLRQNKLLSEAQPPYVMYLL